jgi:valyl-tRNA synthetase
MAAKPARRTIMMDKTFDAKEAEARISKAWMDAHAFRAGANKKPGGKPFSIMIPPPNVTGALHIGHAFNNTLQDILIRWHRMKGDDTLWQPGTDHAGIATQLVVERELSKTNRRRTDFSREDFLQLVWEQKVKSRSNIRNQLERLGASCDWDREAFTMSGAPGAPKGEEGNFHDAVIKVFVEMYNQGLIYRGKRLVNWDPHFETAISDLEVESTEVDGHMWHFKYPLAGGATYEYVEKDADGNVTLRETRNYISIATTRPETMLGDGAVAVHPSDERYKPIVGMLCEIPVGPKAGRRLIPIITDEYPDPTFGSGAVKITGAHDLNDYQVAKRGGIPMYRLMDTKGFMREDGAGYDATASRAQAIAGGAEFTEAEVDTLNLVPDDLRGLDRFEARKRVVAQITGEGLAVMTVASDTRLGKTAVKPDAEGADTPVPLVEAKKIMQPFGDRSKVVIEPMLTDQWFVDTAKIVGPALEAVKSGRTKIMPESGEKTYYHWLENIEPWCISRQLWWGHQIPVWYGPMLDSDGDLVPNERVPFCAVREEDALAAATSYYQTKFDLPVSVSAPSSTDLVKIGLKPGEPTISVSLSGPNSRFGIILIRDPDVLDTWFSSGLWPIGTLGWPEQTKELKTYFPTSVLVTGQDILFFWVARMMMMQLAVVGEVPFDTVYLHGLVRDEKGEKMSKTKGNVIDPLTVVDEYGADALRFTLTQLAVLGGHPKLSTEKIKGSRNFGTKLWNATRFAEMNGAFSGEAADLPNAKHAVNRWIIGEVAKIRITTDQALEEFRFNDAANALYAFVWGKVCDWYVEFAKPLFDGPDADETRKTMAWVIDQCLILLHPIMPFITEELWAGTAERANMLVHQDWPTYGAELVDPTADRELNWVISVIEDIRSARSEVNVPGGAIVDLCYAIEGQGEVVSTLTTYRSLIEKMTRVTYREVTEVPKGAVSIPVPGGIIHLPVAQFIDISAEVARLTKSLEKSQKDLSGLTGRISNPKFIENADPEVVEETREQARLKEAEVAKLKTALARLSGMK